MSTCTFSDSKPHYELLDALRGVAALLVVFHHVFEGFAFAESVNGAGNGIIRYLNHGYLAVDFFFLLSGFVIGYAYDDRWGRGLSLKAFFRRRLIRLHPMVILAALTGLVCFLLQGSVRWDGSAVPWWQVGLALLAAICMIPAWSGAPYEVRGNGEMFPLNGPMWSLFFEYIGNILYALLIRRLSTRKLAILTAVLGGLLIWFTVGDVSGEGMFGVGWTLSGLNFPGGFLRMLFPYSLGMLMSRKFRPVKGIKGFFPIACLVMTAFFAVPYIESNGFICLNGLFEAGCIVIMFPVLLWFGASDSSYGRGAGALYRFLGDISYPLYIVHYPLFYLFYAWLVKTETYSLGECWPQAIMLVLFSLILAFLSLRFYDAPVRKKLKKINGHSPL